MVYLKQTKHSLSVLFLAVAVLLFFGGGMALASEDCIDFEADPWVVGNTYAVGDSVIDNPNGTGHTLAFEQFYWSSGDPASGTQIAGVEENDPPMAMGGGKELNLNNITVAFTPNWTGMFVLFGEHGGNVNLRINGAPQNVENLSLLNGTTLGGVNVKVLLQPGTGTNEIGVLILSGAAITDFAIGGQELWIGEICPECNPPDCDECIHFNDLTAGDEYRVTDPPFTSSGYDLTAQPFTWTGGTTTSDGVATVDPPPGAAHGSGNELNLNNINVETSFTPAWPGLRVFFSDQGGNVNLRVNSDFRNVENLTELDGLNVGGADIKVLLEPGGTGEVGVLIVGGPVNSFAIGGQEFAIDDICEDHGPPPPPVDDCIEFEDQNLGDTFSELDTIYDSGYELDVVSFTYSNGNPATGGFAKIHGTQQSGGTDQDLELNNISLVVINDSGAPKGGLTLLFGEYGGNVNLTVNGDFRNEVDLIDLDGQVVGGVTITVTQTGNLGTLEASGEITEFVIGGQELWIDHICIEEGESPPQDCDCIDYEAEAPGTTYLDGQSLMSEDGHTMTVHGDGYARIAFDSPANQAGHTGNALELNNIDLTIDVDPDWSGLSLHYGYTGGTVTIGVNGITPVTHPSALAFDGTVMGDATIHVSETGGYGVILVEMASDALLDTFIIGGQEFHIDHVCPEPCGGESADLGLIYSEVINTQAAWMWDGDLPRVAITHADLDLSVEDNIDAISLGDDTLIFKGFRYDFFAVDQTAVGDDGDVKARKLAGEQIQKDIYVEERTGYKNKACLENLVDRSMPAGTTGNVIDAFDFGDHGLLPGDWVYFSLTPTSQLIGMPPLNPQPGDILAVQYKITGTMKIYARAADIDNPNGVNVDALSLHDHWLDGNYDSGDYIIYSLEGPGSQGVYHHIGGGGGPGWVHNPSEWGLFPDDDVVALEHKTMPCCVDKDEGGGTVPGDADGNGVLGLGDIIYGLQVLVGLR